MKKSLFILPCILLFFSCKQHQSKEIATVEIQNVIDYQKIGDSIATASQKSLMSNVSSAIKKGGTTYALDFCHANASKITDSLSDAMQVKIQRISYKNRNENNAALTKEDSVALDLFTNLKAQDIALKDTVISTVSNTLYYKPIAMAMPTCLACHGKIKEDIDMKTAALIKAKYPHDKATNYQLGDLRGAWKITFAK